MLRRLLWLFAAGLSGLLVFGVVSARQDPVVARYRLQMPGLRQPLRIVQLSDSHALSVNMPSQRLARVVGMMNALKPDIIVLTGDYIAGDPARLSAKQTAMAVAPFAALRAPMGIFAVPGNHDDAVKTRAALAGTGVRLLVGERVELAALSLIGAGSMIGGSPAVEAMRRAVRRAPATKPSLVIVHEPSFFHFLPPRSTMMIAGHTHGGQVRLPFIGSWSPDRYAALYPRGVFRRGHQTLLVSSGLGTSILPIRIGVPPEIVELTLLPDQVGRNSGTDR